MIKGLPSSRCLFLGLLVLFLAAAELRPAWSQCAMCQETLSSGAEGAETSDGTKADLGGLPRGMFWSIVFLLGAIFSLTGGVVFLIVREGRQPAIPEALSGSPEGGGNRA